MSLKKLSVAASALTAAVSVLLTSAVSADYTADANAETGKITEYTYYFAYDTINSAGTASVGDVRELAITSSPQYFYVDTVEADAIDSITLRSGYEYNSAVTSVYLSDNGGEPVSGERLQAFCSDNSQLIKIASVADSKTARWGYRTALITADGVSKTEGDSYTMLEESRSLVVDESLTGKKALIVGIEGDIGSKAYFDYIRVHYGREVDAPIPVIESVRGGFYASNDNATWTLMYKISDIPASGAITKAGVGDIADIENAYRYIKYTVPNGTNAAGDNYMCNIAEIELCGKAE